MPSYAVITALPADVEMAAPAAAVGSTAVTALPLSGVTVDDVTIDGGGVLQFILSNGGTLSGADLQTWLSGNYLPSSQKGAASGVASLDGSSKVPIAQVPTGTTSSTVAIGNDSRITGALPKALVPTVLDAATYDANDSAQDTLFASLPDHACVQIQAGQTIRRGSALTLARPIHFSGPGTFQDSRTSPTTAFINIPPAASASTFYGCPVKGSIVDTYVANHHAFNFQGTDNGAATPPTYVADVVIRLPELSGFGSMGVGGEFAQNANIEIVNFHNCAYAGVLILSATDVDAVIRNAHDLLPGSTGLSYLIQFSRRANKSDLVRYPNSKNSNGYVGTARNIPQWDGLGCHGMQGGSLGWGTMYGVKKPIDVVPSSGDDSDALTASNNVVINLGHADSGVKDGSYGPAVTISGAIKATDVAGSPTEYAKGIVINAGVLRGYGVQGTTTSGAIYVLGTQGIVINAGSILEPSPVAICIYRENKDFIIKGVSVIDPWSNSGNAGSISIASTYNTGVIESAHTSPGYKSTSTAWVATTAYTYTQMVTKGGYVYRCTAAGTSGSTGPVGTTIGASETDGTVTWLAVATTATNVNNIGLRIAADPSNVIQLGPTADFSSAATPINGTAVGVTLPLPLRALDGTSAAPGITFASNPNTGLRRATTDTLGVCAGGVEVFEVVATAISMNNGKNFAFNTTTGTKIGTASTQKLAFWNATPIVQPSRIGQLTDSSGGTAGSTVTAAGASYSQTDEANFRATAAARINALELLVHNLGLEA